MLGNKVESSSNNAGEMVTRLHGDKIVWITFNHKLVYCPSEQTCIDAMSIYFHSGIQILRNIV